MTSYEVSGVDILLFAISVWFIGTYLTKKISFLRHYNIPVAVTGGLLCSLAITAIHGLFAIEITFDTSLRDLLLLTFFSTIGLSAKFSLLKEGGMTLVILMIAAAVILVLQNGTGVILAMFLADHPGYGLFGGSVSLAGGHGTSIAWGQVAEEAGLVGAGDIGIAFATFGLIAGGVIGGPIAEYLIEKHDLKPPRTMRAGGDGGETADEQQRPYLPKVSSTLGTLLVLAICVQVGHLVNEWLAATGLTLPGFLTAMITGIVIANVADVIGARINDVARENVGEISLQLFLAISLMSMQLWVLAGEIGPILIVLFCQMLVITLFAVWFLFRILGRNYDAAVMVAGFTGLGMGATPVGIANMNAVTSKLGPSPKAFLVVPLVGAFFLDIINALIIKTFIAMPFMQQPMPGQ